MKLIGKNNGGRSNLKDRVEQRYQPQTIKENLGNSTSHGAARHAWLKKKAAKTAAWS